MTKKEKKEYNKRWRDNHPGYDKHYNNTHKEKRKKQHHEHYLKNKKQENEYSRNYRRTHKKECAEATKCWKKEHPEEKREINRKYKNKRRRNLGSLPLNKPFKGCEFHHLDKDAGIYIPKWLHKMYSHNVFTGKNMDKMNDTAIRWWIINQCKGVE